MLQETAIPHQRNLHVLLHVSWTPTSELTVGHLAGHSLAVPDSIIKTIALDTLLVCSSFSLITFSFVGGRVTKSKR